MSQHCGPLDEWLYVKPLQHWCGSTSVVPDKGSDRKEMGLETRLEQARHLKNTDRRVCLSHWTRRTLKGESRSLTGRIYIEVYERKSKGRSHGTFTQRKTDIEANERRSLKQKNIHSVITIQEQQDIDTNITLSTDFRDPRKFVSKLVPVLSTLTRTVKSYSL